MLKGSNSKQKKDNIFTSQTLEDEQVFTQDSSMPFPLLAEEVESDDDDMPLKVLYKQQQATKKKTLRKKEPRK
jgi:hypothetical protein